MIVSCARLAGEFIVNSRGEEVGRIERIMVDVASGRVAHAVVACGGVFGIGEQHYAIPWSALTLDTERRCLVLAVELKDLQNVRHPFLSSDMM